MALKEKITVDMQDAMRSKDSETLNVNIESIHLATEKGLESAMSLFY